VYEKDWNMIVGAV